MRAPFMLGLRRTAAAGALFFTIFASPAAVHAQTTAERTATAQALYESAAALIKQGKHVEACPKLEESQRLDPAMGTQFFLAVCYESTGRPTSAWSAFLEVAAAAKAAGNSVRESTARARAAALEPRLPRMMVLVDPKTTALAGLEIARDGMVQKPVVWGTAVPVDLGAHVVRATAPGKVPWETSVRIDEMGQRVDVSIPVLADMPPPMAVEPMPVVRAPVADVPPLRTVAPPPPPATRPPFPAQRVVALVSAGVGLAGLVAGSAVGWAAKSAWTRAEEACPKHVACSQAAHDQSTQALSLATGSTVSFAIGGVGVASALVLWFTTPSRALASQPVRITPVAGAGRLGLSAEGAF